MNSFWLMAMLISYSVCIFTIVGDGGNSAPATISSKLSNTETNTIILISMLFMGGFTLLYERERKDNISFLAMIFLLVGIYGVITIEETKRIHYVYAAIAFISILVFMFRNIVMDAYDLILFFGINSIIFSILFVLISKYFFLGEKNTVWMFECELLFLEILFLIFFTLFYFSLHFRSLFLSRKIQ
jgi:hypothetical protein